MKYILTLACLFSFYFSYAQVAVDPVLVSGDAVAVREVRGSAIPRVFYDAEDIDTSGLYDFISQTTTYFILPSDIEQKELDALKREINKIWTMTPIEYVDNTGFKKARKKGIPYTMIKLEGSGTYDPYNASSGMNLQTSRMLKFSYYNKARKDHFLACAKMEYSFKGFMKDNSRESFYASIGSDVSKSLGNWNVAYISNALRKMQLALRKGQRVTAEKKFVNKKDIGNLKTNTLYVLKYSLERMRFKGLFGFGYVNKKKLMRRYKYDYKLVTKQELDKIVENSNKPIYYLISGHNNDTEFLTVFNSKKSEIVYSWYIGNSWKLKAKHLKKLSNKIKAH